jgi:hypothetical protein
LIEVVMLIRRQVLPTALGLVALTALVLVLFNSDSEAQAPPTPAPVSGATADTAAFLSGLLLATSLGFAYDRSWSKRGGRSANTAY